MKNIILFCILFSGLFAGQKHTNALIKEDSPYLQQHAHNPVNWYPWGEEAFEKAKKENKLIFLSIGYSTCHWCHVMEDESFKNEEVAKLLNENYVSIKVDREEYPQLDKKYQKLYMSVYGKRGGWPLTVFMSPDVKPFHIETYIPVEEAYGLDGMLKMLPAYYKTYIKEEESFKKLLYEYELLQKNSTKKSVVKEKLGLKTIDKFMLEVEKEFDSQNGGFSKKPKFPESSKLALLLDIYKIYGNEKALHMAEFTLNKMATSGIYDQVGGGFFRYTTDENWQMPHFEKMLYTNAELIPVYVKAYKLTKNPLYKKIVIETIEQIEENFMKDGLYFSASDADSKGEEGGYFIYSYEKVKEGLLKKGLNIEDVEETLAYLGIEEDGNIDGELSLTHISGGEEPAALNDVKNYLKSISAKREFPFIDKKINTAWNAMMIKALFTASEIDKKYLQLASKRLSSLLEVMKNKNILYHQTLFGKTPKQKALLEDYAFLMDALIEGYLKTYKYEYLKELKYLSRETKKKFYKNDIWYLSDDGIESVADFDDRYYTSALSVVLEDFVRIASLLEDLDLNEVVKKTLKDHASILHSKPSEASKLLHVLLRIKRGDVIIKSNLQNLQKGQGQIEMLIYPFVLTKVEDTTKYLACRINNCFSYDNNLSKLLKSIKTAVR